MPSSKYQPNNRSRRIRSLSIQQVLILLVFFAAFFLYRGWQESQNNSSSPEKTPSAQATPQMGSDYQNKTQEQVENRTPEIGLTSSGGNAALRVFFSDPLSNATSGGPEDQLVDAINSAKNTIDMAIYNISLENVANALVAASQRGVKVRVVMESEAMGKTQPTRLRAAGIPIIGDQREGLMHNKFTIIDRAAVWTGSMNYTSTSAYSDFNNLIRLSSREIAQDYTVEFEEMFTDNLFGPDIRTATPYQTVKIDGSTVKIYFSPDDGVADKIISVIRTARTSIDFLAYSFTSNGIADALLERAQAGVTVRGVFDESQVESNTGGEFASLKKAGLAVRQDGIPGLMHAKVFIIDRRVVIAGSYNFTANAENKNDENLVIMDDPVIASQFSANFETVHASSR